MNNRVVTFVKVFLAIVYGIYAVFSIGVCILCMLEALGIDVLAKVKQLGAKISTSLNDHAAYQVDPDEVKVATDVDQSIGNSIDNMID